MLENSMMAHRETIERLCTWCFTGAEAIRLMYLKDHLEELIEYRERVEERRRLEFLRWLVEHELISS